MRIATSVCVADSPDFILYPQLHGLNTKRRAEVYWRCAATLLASLRRTNPGADLLLVSDVDVNDTVQPEMSALLDRLRVTAVHLKFEKFLPPPHTSTKFRNNFYKLDVLSYLSGLSDNQSNLLLDSDVVSLRSLDEMSRQCADSLIIYHPYRESWTESRSSDLSAMLKPIFGDLGTIGYVGGESIGGSTQNLRVLCQLLEAGCRRASEMVATGFLPRLVSGDCIYDNDEYLLSGAVSMLDTPVREISQWLRRIHTNTRYYDTRPDDVELALWHLPGEKTRGFQPLYRAAIEPTSWFWHSSPEAFRKQVGHLTGVPRRSPLKKLAYAGRGALSRFTDRR